MRVSWRKRVTRQLRARLRNRVLAGHGVGIVADTRNGLLVVDAGDFNVSRKLLERGQYDWSQVQLLKSVLPQAAHIVVVGAHIGSLLIPLARACRAAGVIAFEPSPRNRRLLMMNLALNDLAGVVVEPSAVGAAAGSARFTQNPINTGNSRVSRAGEIEVPVVALDAVVPAGWPVIDLLIVDAEGLDVQVLQGAARTLAKAQALYIEYAPEQLEEHGGTPARFAALLTADFAFAYAVRGESADRIEGPLAEFLANHSARGTRFDLLCLRRALPGR